MIRSTNQTRRRGVCANRGNTFVELTVATVVVAVLMLASLQALGQSLLAQAKLADRVHGDLLARSLLSEIVQKAYQEPGSTNPPIGLDASDTVGIRNTYDDVDDYQGLSESPPALPDGTAMPAYAGWTRSVSVIWVDPFTLVASGSDVGAKQITVVTSKNGVVSATVIGYRTSAP
jgi:MSHA pilin protein MshD